MRPLWPFLRPQPASLPSPWPAPLPAPCFSARPSCQGTDQLKIVPQPFSPTAAQRAGSEGGQGAHVLLSPPNSQLGTTASTPAWDECQFGHLGGIPHPFPRGRPAHKCLQSLSRPSPGRGRERRRAVYGETFPIPDKSVPATLWAPRGQGLAAGTGLLRAEGIGVGKCVPAPFIRAQLEGRRNRAPASIRLIPTCVGADVGVSAATPRCHGEKLKRTAEELGYPHVKTEAWRLGQARAAQAGHVLPPISQRWGGGCRAPSPLPPGIPGPSQPRGEGPPHTEEGNQLSDSLVAGRAALHREAGGKPRRPGAQPRGRERNTWESRKQPRAGQTQDGPAAPRCDPPGGNGPRG